MSVNLELYNFFCSIVEYGSFSEASKKLYITQPAITQRINNLETQLNAKLFYRTAKGAKLTTKGEKLYQKVKEPVKLLKNIELEERKNKTNNLKEINIVIIDKLFEINFLYEMIMKFYKLYPDIKVNMYASNEKEELNTILDTDVQFILVSNPKKIRRKNIKIEDSIVLHPCFYASVNYKNNNEKINLNNNNILILPRENTEERKILNKILKGTNSKIENYYETDNPEIKNILLKNGLGIAFGFKENILEELQSGELIELKSNIEIKEHTIYIAEKQSSQINNFSWENFKAI